MAIAIPKSMDKGRAAGLELLGSAILTLVMIPVFLAWNCTLELAVPLALLVGLIACHVLQLMLTKTRDVFSPTTMVAGYFATYFILRSFYLGSVPFFSRMGSNPYDDYLPAALWCALAGYAMFLLGMKSSFARKSLHDWQKRIGGWPETVPSARILLIMFVGLASLLYLFKLGMTVGNYSNLEFQRTPPPGLPVLLENLIGLAWVAICTFLISAQRRSTRRTAWLLMGVSITLLLVNLAISGGKVALIQPLLQAAIVFHYGKRRLRLWEIVAFGVPVLIMAFGIVNFYRFVVVGHLGAPKSLSDVMSRLSSTSDLLSSKHDTAAQKPALEQMVDRDAGVDALALIMKYTPRPFPYVYGVHWLQVPLTVIPRAMWKHKPVNMPSAEFEHTYMGKGDRFNGFSSMHFIADLYRNFSYPGVVAGMFVFGAIVRWFYAFCAPSRSNGTGLFLYAALFPEIMHSLEADVGYAIIIVSRVAILTVATAIFITRQQKGSSPRTGRLDVSRELRRFELSTSFIKDEK